MKTLQVLLSTVLLVKLAGCADFDQEVADRCERDPHSCGLPDPTAPVITQSSQSAQEVPSQGTVTLSVEAQDDETPQLDFSWTASIGTVEVHASTGSTSEVVWTAPLCVPSNIPATVTVRVDNRGTSASKTFDLSSEACRILAVSAGDNHSLALRSDGTVWAWGDNSSGQLGNGTKDPQPVVLPVQVSGLTDVVAVAAGASHSLAKSRDGTVWAWGANDDGQLGDGTSLEQIRPVQVAVLTDVTAVVASANYSLALRGDGTVWAWGDNDLGQIGDGTDKDRAVPKRVEKLVGIFISTVVVGDDHSLALSREGDVWAWGYNDFGEIGTAEDVQAIPERMSGVTGVKALASGNGHSLALREDGTVLAWGDNSEGQLGYDPEATVNTPVKVPGLEGITALAAGAEFSLALTGDGTVWAWGINTVGELGIGTDAPRGLPRKVPGLVDIKVLAAGDAHALVLQGDGTVWAWGANDSGQLGDGDAVDTQVPVKTLSP
ncbi:RCC1 repeat-containing protein [Stigmatella sp. ncwal1]|uniref:RCC1 repeat-containing protein n=1 Tax=Stigmatella ashevillensis TaxID=2995309 RepID=A0ABT5DEI3_9BACT|nr:RCC1 domain-containing protein [Stigmatella ashevillena]MDC0712095.1 RCC1 repeat-containing protein [Stigmatella ashevillena]